MQVTMTEDTAAANDFYMPSSMVHLNGMTILLYNLGVMAVD